MKSRTLVFLLAFAISSVSLQALANTPPKSGTSCSKLGNLKSYQGKKFTCVKAGKKLVWSKGVVEKKAAPASTPSPTPTATPTFVAQPTPSPTILTPLQKMYQDFFSRYKTSVKSTSPSFNFVKCPNVDKTMADITERAYVDAYSLWASIYKASAKVNWLLMSEKDWDCWYENTGKFEGPNSVSRAWKTWDKEKGILGHCNVISTAFCGYGTGVRDGGVFAQYNLIGSDYKISPTPMTVHHETVHIYQMQLIADNYLTSKASTLACWFIEGQANLFGIPIAFSGDPTAHRNFEKGRLLKVYPNGDKYTPEEWLKVLNDLKGNSEFCFKNELGYSLGWFALEWTYLNYSVEDMHQFLLSIAKGSTWEQAIQNTMKIDEQSYLLNIAKYLSIEL